VEECSVAPLCNKRVKTLCGCREERVQTKEKYKLRLTTKAYKLSYNYMNYTIHPVGRPFGKWRRRRLCSGGSRRVRGIFFLLLVYIVKYFCCQALHKQHACTIRSRCMTTGQCRWVQLIEISVILRLHVHDDGRSRPEHAVHTIGRCAYIIIMSTE
jgi:hypothetical protein